MTCLERVELEPLLKSMEGCFIQPSLLFLNVSKEMEGHMLLLGVYVCIANPSPPRSQMYAAQLVG